MEVPGTMVELWDWRPVLVLWSAVVNEGPTKGAETEDVEDFSVVDASNLERV